MADVAYVFIFSPEFQGKGYDNADYVEQLYVSLMGRSSDPAGKANWVSSLEQGMSREYVFLQFVNSGEFQALCGNYGIVTGAAAGQNENVTQFVARSYSQFLGRNYDVDGLNNWCAAVNNGTQTLQQLAYGFVFSPECQDMGLSNEDFVAMLYRGCFDREGDPDGLANWVNCLNSGEQTREDVFWGFADSQEFSDMTRRYGL